MIALFLTEAGDIDDAFGARQNRQQAKQKNFIVTSFTKSEAADRFTTSPTCHALLHPIALGLLAERLAKGCKIH